ncbi:sensor histidine kinase [Paenibacillus sp. H1-7]|uniref:sensor histidine kinase n=1 Tax=Paenibacillus sp. H1-7 TaxID=2282849 RepID=UPI001EF92A98|nr:histidine kinase [Paenibacillus sp. H1-7]ULL13167.1 sensor histidine kinase [Paenibacillus sp. H1-7]
MFRTLQKYPLRHRLRIAFAVMIIVSVLTVGWTTYYISAQVVQNNALKLSQDTLNKSSQAFDEKLKHVAVSLMTLVISTSYENTMKDVVTGDSSNYFTHFGALQTPFMQLKLNEQLLHSVLLTTPIGDFYPADVPRTEFRFKDTSMYDRIREERHAIWIEGHKDPFFAGEVPVVSLVISAISSLYIPDSYIIVNLKEDGLWHFLTDNISDWREGVTMLKEDGSPLFVQKPYKYADMLKEPEFQEQLKSGEQGAFDYDWNGNTYLANFVKSSVDDKWTYVSVKPTDELLSQATGIKWATLIVTVLCIVLGFFISNGLSTLLAKPLTKLQLLMRRAGENDLTVRFETDGNDEVTQVGRQFNRMLEQIGQLIEVNRRVEKDKHKAEIKALQAQIDPHFLYNTLNTIYWKTKLKKSDEVGEMVMSLSRMFQLGLNGGKELTTIKKELFHVEQYLSLQQRCYENLFEYRIEAPNDESIQQHPILKVLLQPLVENAILHGFKNKQAGGLIVIRLEQDDDRLVFTISDNGHGMDKETLQNIRRAAESSDSYALHNIVERLKLYYENEAAFSIDSVPGEGTTVTLTIPWYGGGEEDGVIGN